MTTRVNNVTEVMIVFKKYIIVFEYIKRRNKSLHRTRNWPHNLAVLRVCCTTRGHNLFMIIGAS